MKKKLFFAGAAMMLTTAITGFAAYNRSSEADLLDANIEALTRNETEDGRKTCYHINVQTGDSPLLLSCSTCTYEYGWGTPVATCP